MADTELDRCKDPECFKEPSECRQHCQVDSFGVHQPQGYGADFGFGDIIHVDIFCRLCNREGRISTYIDLDPEDAEWDDE